jgi:hypothetical protein
MTFADLPAGVSVFLDANTLLYHFTADAAYGTASTDLLGADCVPHTGVSLAVVGCNVSLASGSLSQAPHKVAPDLGGQILLQECQQASRLLR